MMFKAIQNIMDMLEQPMIVTPKKQIVAESNMPAIYDMHVKAQTLSPRLAKGGEGEIYPLQGRGDILVKHYLDEVLNKDRAYLQAKITAMQALRPEFKAMNISWVAISVFDAQQQWRGYAMKKVEGHTMRSLAHMLLYKKHAPNLNRRDVANLMLSWLEVIQQLHQKQVMIGDYNLSNFMWNPATLEAGFIDCDSYQIQYQGQTYRCLVGSPDLTAPEHHGQSFRQVVRTPQSEYFSIAIILFMCFMLGRHPYDIVDGEDPVKNLQQGKFAYGKGNNGKRNIPKGQWYNIWSHMPYAMKNLFIQTFTEGAAHPSKRASIEQWQDVLQTYIKEMDKGYHITEMVPAQPKTSERQ